MVNIGTLARLITICISMHSFIYKTFVHYKAGEPHKIEGTVNKMLILNEICDMYGIEGGKKWRL